MDTSLKMPRKPYLIALGAIAVAAVAATLLTGCDLETTKDATEQESAAVERQQQQYAKGQPVPAFDWSLERALVVELYGLRNEKVTTHAVWLSAMGQPEGDCAAMGYGIPYDASLTNPQQAEWRRFYEGGASAVVGQPEPNGIFQSTNTSATWIMCVDEGTGALAPVYTESKVTVYPYPVTVDYASGRVSKAGDATVTIQVGNG